VERYLQIAKANLKFNLYPHLLLCIVFLGLSPFLMGVENLDAARSAMVLEMYTALLGIILLTPVFLPEQNKDLRDLVEAKFTSRTAVVLIRVLEAGFCLAVLTGAFILFLQGNNCVFPVMKYYLGTLAEALFLGGLGLCAYSLFDQIAVAYMLPVMYYILCVSGGGKLMKDFYLFSMLYGGYREKINLAATGLVLVLIGIGYPYLSKRLLPGLLRRGKHG
jgi:hypothetical protein